MSTHRIPRVAVLAARQADRRLQDAITRHAEDIDEIGRQTVVALGLDPDASAWGIDFQTGLVTERIPEPEPKKPEAADVEHPQP